MTAIPKKSTVSSLRVGLYLFFLRTSKAVSLLIFAVLVFFGSRLVGNFDATSSEVSLPSDLVFRGAHSSYAKVPIEYRKTYHLAKDTCNNMREPVQRAFNEIGWRRTDDMSTAFVLFRCDFEGALDWYAKELHALQPYQRHNHLPGQMFWESKLHFLYGMESYRQRNPDMTLHMLPESYILRTQEGISGWKKRLFQDGGIHEPWVLKTNVNGGKGIEILAPNSPKIKSLVSSLDYQTESDPAYLVQAYICNELTWYGNRKMDLRFYWMVASLDPLIVLFHDGLVRVSSSKYNEDDFSETRNHLTTYTNSPNEFKAPAKDLANLIREHYKENSRTLKKSIKIDPWEHVRNQMKESIAVTIDAFKGDTFGFQDSEFSADNGYGIYGCDFVIDKNLHALYLEPQLLPGWEEENQFRVNLNQDILQSGFKIVEEIQNKLEMDPTSSVLPLNNQGEWDIVYAQSEDESWMYRYEGFIPQRRKRCANTKLSSSGGSRLRR